MPELQVAIIGCGRMGSERARCVQRAGARLATVFDVDNERSARLACAHKASPAPSIEALLSTHPDAIFICTAPGLRAPLETICIERGIAFFVEKPAGTSLAQCEPILEALDRRPVVNAVGYMNRCRRSVQLARSILQGEEVLGLSAHWVSKRYQVPWWGVTKLSGGPHNEQATHLFDLSRYLAGEASEVKTFFSGDSRAATALRFDSGSLGTLFYSCDGRDKDIGVRVMTASGSLLLSGWDFKLVENTIDGRLAQDAEEDAFLVETIAFLAAVQGESPSLVACHFSDAARTQALLDAARESALQAGARERHPLPAVEGAL